MFEMLAIFLVASFDSISEIVRVRKLEFEAKVQFLSCDLGWFCWFITFSEIMILNFSTNFYKIVIQNAGEGRILNCMISSNIEIYHSLDISSNLFIYTSIFQSIYLFILIGNRFVAYFIF